MIGVEDLFSCIDDANGILTVAASLEAQGCIPDINIPVYEVFYIHIITGEKTEFLADNIPEYNMLRQMNMYCGSVAVTCNLLGIDLLTLIGLECIFTPNTGMNIFAKVNVDLLTTAVKLMQSANGNLVPTLCSMAGVPLPDFMKDGYAHSNQIANQAVDFVGELLDTLLNMLLDAIGESCTAYGINFCSWDGLPEFYDMLEQSGEMQMMAEYRAQYENLQHMIG